MKVKLNSTNAELVFTQTGRENEFISPTLGLAPVLDARSWAAGPVVLRGASRLSKQGVRSVEITVQVPVIDTSTLPDGLRQFASQTDMAGTTQETRAYAGNGTPKFIQARLMVSLPNNAGLACSASVDAPSSTQADANARALDIALDTLLACVAKQGSAQDPVLAYGGELVNPDPAGTSDAWLDSHNPLLLGSMGAQPFDGTDRSIARTSS